MSGVVLSEKRGQVHWLSINRVERQNALDRETILTLRDQIVASSSDPETRVIVLTGVGSAFCAGADLRASQRPQGPPNEDLLEEGFNTTIRALWNSPKPVIAAVNGVAVGFGCSLALAADIRVAAVSARFSLIFVRRGLTVDGGASYLLPRLAGLRGLEMALTGDMVNAEDALRMGFVNRVVADVDLYPTVTAVAERLTKNAPLALSAIKASFRKAMTSSLDETLTYEMDQQRRMAKTEDFREGVAAFLEKRDPIYKGR